jgi:hypothetical protein
MRQRSDLSQELQLTTACVVGSLRRSTLHACPADACGCQGTLLDQLYVLEQFTYIFHSDCPTVDALASANDWEGRLDLDVHKTYTTPVVRRFALIIYTCIETDPGTSISASNADMSPRDDTTKSPNTSALWSTNVNSSGPSFVEILQHRITFCRSGKTCRLNIGPLYYCEQLPTVLNFYFGQVNSYLDSWYTKSLNCNAHERAGSCAFQQSCILDALRKLRSTLECLPHKHVGGLAGSQAAPC